MDHARRLPRFVLAASMLVLVCLTVLGFFGAPQPARACLRIQQCPTDMHWWCDRCLCDCPLPGTDPEDPSTCGPCF